MKQITVEKIENRAKDIIAARSKIYLLEYILKSKKSVLQECLEFGIPRSTFYEWKKKYEMEGKEGLLRKKPIANNHPKKIQQPIIDKVLDLRENYQLGPIRISRYLIRYHGIKISESSVYRILQRNNCSRLPKSASRRTIHTKSYSKNVPGHHVQVDVKFAFFQNPDGKKIKKYQYTAMDDATRIRALKLYSRHNQKSAMNFIDYVIEKFPFRIHTIRTDRGHEFQAKFHWCVEDKGIRHVYIKPKSPQLNGKVECSHRTDQEEFYQLLTYTDDVYFMDEYSFVTKRIVPEYTNDIEVLLDVEYNESSAINLLYVIAYDQKYEQYVTTSNIFFKPNAFRPRFTTVDGGYGCFGSLTSLEIDLNHL